MGLFKKKPDPDLAAMRAELTAVTQRLDVSEQSKTILEDRLRAVDATTRSLSSNAGASPTLAAELSELRERLTEIESGRPAASTTSGDDDNTDEIPVPPMEDLTEQLDVLARRLDEVAALASAPAATDDSVQTRLDLFDRRSSEINALTAQLGELSRRTAGGASDQPAGGTGADVSAQLAELTSQLHTAAADARVAREQSAALEQRLSNVSTELANQLDELGKEIDSLGGTVSETAAPTAPTVSTETVDALQTGQVRLANEQARYEIAFREDLAVLAEQVRTLRGR